MNHESWKIHNQVVDYLRNNFYTTDFINNHTRKQLAEILQIISPYQGKQLYTPKLAFTNMCKKRACKHIDFYLKLHNIKCKEDNTNEI